MPMLSWPPLTTSLTLRAFGNIKVSGPGRELLGDGGQIGNPAMQIARIVQMHDHRVVRGPSLRLEDLAYRGWIGGIGAEAVNRLGWKCHQISAAQGLYGLFDFSLSSSYHRLMIIKTGSGANADSGSRSHFWAIAVFNTAARASGNTVETPSRASART